jgi:RHS repeat-associated protein
LTGELPNQGYAGLEQDEESEYIQMGARTNNPALGRFMSVDPLFESFPGQSGYSYAFNSPLSWSDPSGLTGKGLFKKRL